MPDVVLDDDPADAYGERTTPCSMPGGGRAELALHLHLGETLVHGWDLARSIGTQPAYDDDIVEASLAYFRSWLPPMRPPGAPFAGARPEPAAAAPIDRLAAYLGRDVEAWSS